MPHINKQMASFFLTTKCNLCCSYCYNRTTRAHFNDQSLPFHIAKKGMDYYFSTNENRHIRFYGPGEPTQDFELLKAIVDYGYSTAAGRLTIEIQTNGCFSQNIAEWLLDNLNIIWISVDGEPYIQNTNRPLADGQPSSPIIENNVRYLINNANKRKSMVGARVTITNDNANRQKQMIDYFLSLGMQWIWSDPLFPSVGKIPTCDDIHLSRSFNFDMDNYIDNYIEAYHYGKAKNVFYGSFLACNFDGKCNKHCRACIPSPHFTTDGYVSACDLVTFGKDARHMDCFVYGKWNEDKQSFDFDQRKIKRLQSRAIENMSHCSSCVAGEYCGGYCLGEVMNETGNLYGQKHVACRAIRRLLAEIGIQGIPYEYFHP